MKKSYTKFSLTLPKCLITVLIFATLLFVPGLSYATEITPENVLAQLNQERISHRLKPLEMDVDLNQAATMKAKDMINRDYFEHYAYGLTPWDFIKNSGYDYLYAGENLAMNFETTEGMVRAWMNSPAHRENILDPDFGDTGIGIVKGEYTEGTNTYTTIMVANMFGQKKPAIIQYFDNIVSTFISFFRF